MNVQIIRSLCVLLIGFLFLALGDSALSLLVVVVGVLLMIPGVFALVSYLRHLEQRPMFPLAALGSFVLGLWMVMSPAFFVSFFMYVVGGVLVALGVYQLAGLSVTSRALSVAWPLYILPVIVLLLGLFVIFNPFEAAAFPIVLIGVGCIFSSINDLIAALRSAKLQKKSKQSNEFTEAEIME
jgi:uncharacterized membrane protein HdeD (DUF308 family)